VADDITTAEDDSTPGRPQASMSSKSDSATVMFSAIPW